MSVAGSLLSAFLCCSAGTLLLLGWLEWRKGRGKLEEAQRRRERALERMEQAVGRFKEKNPGHQPAPILSFTLSELWGKLQNGLLSPESVFYTYVEKALKVHRDVNCLTDFLENSEYQLQHVKKQAKKGLLYGVPISIKDSVDCKGHDSTLGLVKRLNKPAAADAVIVQVLKQQGAIPFVKTNVPQSLLCYDCSNLIFGKTVHPLDHSKSPGGSSGGDAALIKSGGSILGIGTDVGGSIRIPSAFCGICGFKTTGNRVSKKGIIPSIRGQKSAVAGLGPMARDVDSLALCLRALLCDEMFELDPTVPPIHFNEQVFTSSQPLRIGYYTSDNFLEPSPSMKRAVLETKQLLEKAGHTLVPFKPFCIEHILLNIAGRGLFADGGATLSDSFKGESRDPTIKELAMITRCPDWLKSLLSWIFRPISTRLSISIRSTRKTSVKELWELHTEIEECRQEFIAEWKKLDLDVTLCPVLGPAFTAGFPGKVSLASCYTILYNYLDFPAGVVPVTTVTEEDEEDLKSLKGYYNDIWDRNFIKAVQKGVGLPVAVQCVALPWQEELCLRFMKEVEKLTQDRKRKP